MKNILLALAICIIFSTPIAYATSGACSSHGGVNCGKGPTSNSNVTCNDGWINSTANYWDAQECRAYLCPAQKVLRAALIQKAQDSGALDIGVSQMCTTLGLTGYSSLMQCLNMRRSELNQTYLSIDSEVDSFRYTCKTSSTPTTTNTNAGGGNIIPFGGGNGGSSIDIATLSKACPENSFFSPRFNRCSCAQWADWNKEGTACIQRTTPLFNDVDYNDDYQDSIDYMKTAGIADGYGDGTFRPDNQINRAEFVKIVTSAAFPNELKTYKAKTCFKDVGASTWFSKYVCMAKDKDMLGGYPDGTFQPNQHITFAEAFKIGLAAWYKDIPSNPNDIWYKRFFDFVQSKNLSMPEWTSPDRTITRGEMAEFIYRIKKDTQK